MKKNIKKCFALLLAVVMTLTMAMTVFADDIANNYSITINAGKYNAATKYNIYKLYSATVSEATNSDGQTTIGTVYKVTGDFAELSAVYGDAAQNINSTNLQNVIEAAMGIVNGNKKPSAVYNVEVDTTTQTRTISVDPGYYLIVATSKAEANESDTPNASVTNPREGGTVTSPCLVAVPGNANVSATGVAGEIVKNVTVTPKASETTLDKTITGSAKTAISATGDSSTAAVGDTIEYTLTSTVPAYGADVDKKTIKYMLTDAADATLDYSEIVSVKCGGTELGKDAYTLNTSEHGFVMDFDYSKLTPNATVVVKVNFILNNNAVIGNANVNNAKLTYTNNYYTGETSDLKDKVETYTFGFGIKKIDSVTKEPIKGAEFEIKDKDGKLIATIKADLANAGDVIISIKNANDTTTEIKGADTGSYVITGLQAGEYTVTETKAPDGYKLLASPVSVTVTAKKAENSDEFNGTYTVEQGSKAVTEDITFEGKKATGFAIENTQGTTLPGTGGMGTTLFTFGGIALILVACVMFIVYTRKQKKQS